MTQYFQFEADFVDSLRCIPMQVRLKLDTCGVKLKLPQWHQLTQAEREQLVESPCTTPAEAQTYRSLLQQWVQAHTGEVPKDLPIDPQPEWMTSDAIPESVQQQSQAHHVAITVDQWQALTPLQRFALIKLSRSSHENKNFLPACKEFHLL